MQYNYQSVDLEIVMRNIGEYVIPECQKACLALWDKNIETHMCSNYDNNVLWITFILTSEENIRLFEELMKNDPDHYCIDTYHHRQKIVAESEEELLRLIEPFTCQDVRSCRYEDSDSFLEHYRSFRIDEIEEMQKAYHLTGDIDGMPAGLVMNEYGVIMIDRKYSINPLKKDATLDDALRARGKELLYVEDEKRVYSSPLFLKWHLKYLKYLLKTKDREERTK